MDNEYMWFKLASELGMYFIFKTSYSLEIFREMFNNNFTFKSDLNTNIDDSIKQIYSWFKMYRVEGNYESDINILTASCKKLFKLK